MYNGILVVNKPAGMTSHDVVFRLRKMLRMKKIGHTGTLDPNVEGVLICCLGQATKLVEHLMDGQKGYRGEITLGIATETEDADGAIIDYQPLSSPFDTASIDQAMAEMVGDIIQIPPYYSAVKVQGKRLYEYARAGETVERPRRQARIDHFQRLNEPVFDQEKGIQRWSFDVLCGKGTYVRTLAVDLGKRLGVPSHMSQLVRYQTGGYRLEEAYDLAQLAQALEEGRLEQCLISLEQAVAFLPHYFVSDQEWFAVRNGQVMAANQLRQPLEDLTAFLYRDQLVALYGPHPTKPGYYKPDRMFHYTKE